MKGHFKMKGLSQLSHQMLANLYPTKEFSHYLFGFMLHRKHESQWSNIKNSVQVHCSLLREKKGTEGCSPSELPQLSQLDSSKASPCFRRRGRLIKPSLKWAWLLSPPQFIWGHAYWDWAVHVRVTALLLLFVSMDTGGKVALIGCLAQPVSGLFPDGGGAVAALVEQHIGLVGLKLVLWDCSHTGVIVEAPPIFIWTAGCVVAHVYRPSVVTYCI